MRAFVLTLLLGSILFISGCKKDDITYPSSTRLKVDVDTQWNGEELKLDSVYLLGMIHHIKITDLKFYLSDFHLVNNKGVEFAFQFKQYDENVFLFDLRNKTSFEVEIPEGEYMQLKFNVGLAPQWNDLNPNPFPTAHPLSRDHDMYWDMTKYRFLVMEGVVNHPEPTQFNHYLSYHLGGEQYLREVVIDFSLNVLSGQKAEKVMNIDLEKIFQEIDYTTFFSFHSEGSEVDNGLKMMDNFVESIH